MKSNLWNCLISGVLGAIIIILVARHFYNPSIDEPLNATLANPFELHIGEYARIDSENMTLQFYNITDDSRCPIGVQCIWAGQVTAAVEISRDGENLTYLGLTLRNGAETLSVKSFDGYYIKLIKLDPFKEANQTIERSDYRAVFVVSKI